MPYSFFTSILLAGLLEVFSAGASNVSFNWWLRADNVNNYSVVIVSDVFIALIFFIVAVVLVVRLVKRWNAALLSRVSSIRVVSAPSSSTSFPVVPNSPSKPQLLASETSALLANHNNNNINISRSSNANDSVGSNAAVLGFDAISVSLHEVRLLLQRLFIVDGHTFRWLLLAAAADTFHSLCETYASGKISVMTQLFLKAAEPFLVWLLALKWRSHETSLQRSFTTLLAPTNGREHQQQQQQREDDEEHAVPNSSSGGRKPAVVRFSASAATNTDAHGNNNNNLTDSEKKNQAHHRHIDVAANDGEYAQTNHNNDSSSNTADAVPCREPSASSPSSSLVERWRRLWCCCCSGNSSAADTTIVTPTLLLLSSFRLGMSLLSFICVAAGIAAHFALKIKKENDEKAAEKSSSNMHAFYIAMYCFSVIGSALYAIAFGRYLFLARRISAYTDPLDVIDLIRAVENRTAASTAGSIGATAAANGVGNSSNAVTVEHQVHVVGARGLSDRSFARERRRSPDVFAANQQLNHDDDDDTAVNNNNAASAAAPDAVALDLADDPRDLDVGCYHRRSSLNSAPTDRGDDDNDHGDGAMAWGETFSLQQNNNNNNNNNNNSIVSAPPRYFYSSSSPQQPNRSSKQQQQHAGNDSPALRSTSPDVDVASTATGRRSVGQMSMATSSTIAGLLQRGGRPGGNRKNTILREEVATSAPRHQNEALAILEENRSEIAPSQSDVRLIACFLETFFALVLSVLLAPAFEFIVAADATANNNVKNNGTVATANSSNFIFANSSSSSSSSPSKLETFSDLLHNTGVGISALSSPSTLFPASVTLVGWTLVYAADSVLNHLNAPLSSMINQLSAPLTAIFLYAAPTMDPSGDPADKFPGTAVSVQVVFAVASVLLLCVGSLLMYVAERSVPSAEESD